jgi:hypothetical protein
VPARGWNEGQHTIARLYADIRQEGYQGGYGMVYTYLQALREAGTIPPAAPAPPMVGDVTGWIMSRPDTLTYQDRQRLEAVLARCPELASAAHHVRDFADMLTTLRGDKLPQWLAGVYLDIRPGLHSFAHGIDRDRQAVTAGLTLPYSSGVVEGANNIRI